jgi:hypothetical protein
MSDELDDDEGMSSPDGEPTPSGGPQSEQVSHAHVSALVPERVARGVFSTGVVVVQGAHEFILDFLLRMNSPQLVAARVVLSPEVVPRLISALRENIGNYERKHGRLSPPQARQSPSSTGESQPGSPEAPSPEGGAQPGSDPNPSPAGEAQQGSAQDLYDQLKIPDDVLSGVYANAVMIGHTATEFSFDFITTFFPKSAVAARVYLAAPNGRRFLDSLSHSFEQYKRKLSDRQRGGNGGE